MNRWMARVKKERPADLAGQTLVAASYFQGLGSAAAQLTYGLAKAAGELNPLMSRADAEQRAASQSQQVIARTREGFHRPPGSLAAGFPDSKGVLAVTDSLLFVFGYHQGIFRTRIEAPQVCIALEDLTGWSHVRGSFAWTLNLSFNDDSDVGLDLPIANRPGAFIEALGIPQAAAPSGT
ncbi:hypothetical protein [Castellaniella sp.]|uniref:hypothetical protein n=1 Tax=Castellaniella sp. TaxID=1955812 RepID=UPI00356AB054